MNRAAPIRWSPLIVAVLAASVGALAAAPRAAGDADPMTAREGEAILRRIERMEDRLALVSGAFGLAGGSAGTLFTVWRERSSRRENPR